MKCILRQDADRSESLTAEMEPHLHHMPAACLFGVQLHDISLDDLHRAVIEVVLAKQRAVVANVNIHAMNLAYERPWLRKFLNRADIVFCDGFGVKWGVRLLGHNISHRYTPPDWIEQLSEIGCEYSFSFFFLGARPGVAEKAAARLKERLPNLQIVGTNHGYFEKTSGNRENEAIIQKINTAKPNILVVGFGMPLQERWLMENWDRLEVNVAITAGALFDYISGRLVRAPRWMTHHGFEWMGRLVIEPRRLWRRYLIGNPLFVWRVIKERLGLLCFE